MDYQWTEVHFGFGDVDNIIIDEPHSINFNEDMITIRMGSRLLKIPTIQVAYIESEFSENLETIPGTLSQVDQDGVPFTAPPGTISQNVPDSKPEGYASDSWHKGG